MPIAPDFVKKIIGDESPITCRPADRLAPELDALREKIAGYIEQDEDVLSYALFEQVAIKFFEARKAKKYGIDATSADAALGVHSV
jgi:oxaloacetate decarboxylase alpha subunit